jgi:isopentenyl-diphosphate delta-isomerase
MIITSNRHTKLDQPFLLPDNEIVEVLDAHNRPFMLMPRKQALQQKLPLKMSLVIVRNNHGKIYIQQSSKKKATDTQNWTVSAAVYVKAGEAFEDAALRELGEKLSLTSLTLKLMATTAPAPVNNNLTALFLTTPAQFIIAADQIEKGSGMFVDKDEFSALLRDMPEIISPALKLANELCNLFNE